MYRALTVRQRSRTLPEGLEARRWEPRTLWAIDVFSDSESVARGLADRLGVEPADETDEADDDAPLARRAAAARAGRTPRAPARQPPTAASRACPGCPG